MKTILFLIVLICSVTSFAQDKNLDIKIKYKLTRFESFSIDDKPGHILATSEGTGTAEINTETAKLKSTFNTDYVKGTGDFLVYYTLTAEDNSMLVLKGTGKTTNNNGIYNFNGKVIVESGTGKFETYTGSGTLTGSRKSNIERGSEAEIEILIKLD